ncbi:FecR family protein [Methylovirgula sp. 4M-Z18]|uniref:FecR family protein n=1 Tax=Methylovirgula sp. 4M-Z18 TaxID=2293567 RepID=UPI000E2F5DF5|nr:FecR domain-containing protein [Methylovirgula sp. 4M-Z18]RFB78412.1 hypothetical protein DYH55_16865 [Methylovirgula sp. 4M-Z18]
MGHFKNFRFGATLLALCIGIVLSNITVAAAQDAIGDADVVHNDVRHTGGAHPGPLAQGDNVIRNETVRTAADSTTKLVFLDQTNLSLGPVSQVVLDKFVYSDASSAQKVSIGLAKGVFRFATGTFAKPAYDIETPVATIGVRGTILDIRNASHETTVTVVEGLAIVCPRRHTSVPLEARKDCVRATTGQTVIVHTEGGSLHARLDDQPFRFAEYCAADQALCSQTTYAGLSPAEASVDALCGR